MPTPVGTVTSVLRHLRDRVAEAAVTLGVELPERQYVTTGGAVFDCSQMSVSANRLSTGIAGDQSAPQGGASACPPGWNVDLELAIVRDASEMPSGTRGEYAPDVECIEADTDVSDRDAAVLLHAVSLVAGPNWDQYGSVPASIAFGEVEGGLTAVTLSVTLNLWQIPEEQP